MLINVYCPNTGTGTNEREKFKRNYHKLLEGRVDALIKEDRGVMVVGDLSACAAVQDHCESLKVPTGCLGTCWGPPRREKFLESRSQGGTSRTS